MEKVFVDTSGWVALFVANDQNHTHALHIFEEIRTTKMPMYTSDYVIDETITTILKKGGHTQSVTAGKALITSNLVRVVYVGACYFENTWNLFQKYSDKTFSFTDVSSFSIMNDLSIKRAFSFDQDFQQVGFELVR